MENGEDKDTFEVVGYITRKHFVDRDGTVLIDGIISKDDAINYGHDALDSYEYIKVQNVSREDITIVTNDRS